MRETSGSVSSGRRCADIRSARGAIWTPVGAPVRRWAGELADVVLPTACGGCDEPGWRWCPSCAEALADLTYRPPIWLAPDRGLRGMPAVAASGPYAGVLRVGITRYKDGDRRDLAVVLVPLLAASMRVAAVRAATEAAGRRGRLLFVPMPSSRSAVRARGDRPVSRLTLAAAGAGRVRVADVLRPVRTTLDQVGLDRRGRAANMSGALAVPTRHADVVAGAHVVLVDDVVTTGATLSEAARAIRLAGGRTAAAAVLAATRRRTSWS